MDFWSEVVWVVGGTVALIAFALAIAVPHISRILPGSGGHRDEADEIEHEEVRPDGLIDVFAREIEEAGGGLPTMIKLTVPAVLAWWLLYLVLNWTPTLGG